MTINYIQHEAINPNSSSLLTAHQKGTQQSMKKRKTEKKEGLVIYNKKKIFGEIRNEKNVS